jgi:hypothetical protein
MKDPALSLLHFRFHLEPKAPLRMPAYNKGNVIRGGFGSTFRRIVCHANCREPETCELRGMCPYTAVFHPFVPEDSEKISKNRDIPRPFVIKPPLETKETYLPGERLSFTYAANHFPMRGELKDPRYRGINDCAPGSQVTLACSTQVSAGWPVLKLIAVSWKPSSAARRLRLRKSRSR